MRESLKKWVLEAVDAAGGEATPTEVAKHIWERHETELRSAGDSFYTWQYDMRWAAQKLRNERILKIAANRKWARLT
jgi:hypothetical protein